MIKAGTKEEAIHALGVLQEKLARQRKARVAAERSKAVVDKQVAEEGKTSPAAVKTPSAPIPPKSAKIDKPDETARALAQLRRKRAYMRGYMKRYRAQLAKAE